MKVPVMLNSFYFADSGVESSTTYLGQDGGAISDCELTQSQSIDEVGEALASPAPTLEDAMQRLAETIKGQLISKGPFGVIVWTKIPTKKFENF